MKKINFTQSLKRNTFIIGAILLIIVFFTGTIFGSESTLKADSSACDYFYAGAAIKLKKDTPHLIGIVVHAISKEKGLITVKYEGKEIQYINYTCDNLKQAFDLNTR
jgi:hypothetical protein